MSSPDLRALNRFGAAGGAMWRTAYSQADMDVPRLARRAFRRNGLAVSIDGVGNLFGRDPAAKRACCSARTATRCRMAAGSMAPSA